MTDPRDAEQLEATISANADWVRDLYRHFHRHPELSMQEHQTADRIAAELESLGLSPKRVAGTGVVVVIENGPGATVLARGDIDALPVTEDTGLEYSSEVEGVMHACGHDAHAAALLGAVRFLAEQREAWSGTYIAVFQPGEETAAGARAMIDDGLVDLVPKPDVALSQHVLATEAGTIGTVPGPVLSAADSIRVTLHGRGAHGSMPHTSVDPVVLAASIVLRLQTIVAREVEPGQFAVVTVGALNAGTTANIIPDRAELLLNVRTYDPRVREYVSAAIERIIRGECEAAGTPEPPTFEYYDQYPLTSNDADLTDQVTQAFLDHFGDECVYRTAPQTASEDFSRLPDAFGAPYVYWTVGSVEPRRYRDAVARGAVAQEIPANHSPYFAPVEGPTLLTATRAQVVAALAFLGSVES